ncbi:MAG TPA: GWxTD domain-containing protein [Acidobacteriaceae bacterium]|nr:GWxTD domain-containing protein [Acidobacteriaceae bacterium]
MRTPGRPVPAIALTAVLVAASAGWSIAWGQDAAPPANSNPNGVTQTPPVEAKPNPTKRRLSDNEKFQQQKELKQELKGDYKKWLDEDVNWIITDTERQAFKNLTNDEERDAFIENFWRRRNPNPDSPDNEYRDEIFARIAYANDHFAAGKPGYLTDRGHIYIAWGPPDDKETHPSGGEYQRPMEEGGGSTSTYPFEIWHYRYLEGIGENVNMEFVDTCQCGDYHYTIDRSEKDALKYVPNAGLTEWEENGQAQKKDRFQGGGLEQLGLGPMSQQNQSKQFERLDEMAKIMAPPPIKFGDLEDFNVTSKILRGPPLLFDVRTDYVKVTNETVNVPITVQIRNSDLTFNTKDGVSTAKVEIQGWVYNLTHRMIQSFGDPLEVDTPAELLPQVQKQYRVYWKSLYLKPGLYKVDIVMKDVNNPDHIGKWTRSLNVPQYDDDTLGHSSLILADQMYHVPSKEIGAGNFVIADTFVRPRVSVGGPATPPKFSRSQNLDFWMQVYNLGIDDKTKQNNAAVEYTVADATGKVILDKKESTTQLSPNSDQLTLEKSMPLASLQPGQYQVSIKVDDAISKQHTENTAKFTVE